MNEVRSAGAEAAADLLVTPEARPGRPSAIVWERAFDVLGTDGAIACWSSGSGPTVLLVHGWEGTHADLDAFVAPLLAAGRRVVTLDAPAHGVSEGTTASIPSIADAVARVIAQIGPVSAVIAHSMGCAASVIAREHGSEIARFILIAPPERFIHGVRAVAAHHGLDPRDVEAALVARGIDVPSLDLPKSAASRTEPLLLLHSADDRVCDIGGARRSAAAWTGSEFVEVDGLGHNRILREPSVVEAAVAFALA